MNNNKSVIEWLGEQLQAPCRGIPSHIIEEAKEMHKQEIIDTYKNAQALVMLDPTKRAEQYFYELYEKDKK